MDSQTTMKGPKKPHEKASLLVPEVAIKSARRPGGSKYRNVRVEVDGLRFDSKREAARYLELRRLEAYGQIRDLARQVRFKLVVEGVLIGTYIADFEYWCGEGKDIERIVEDVKSIRTPVYRLKKKLVKALYGVDILET